MESIIEYLKDKPNATQKELSAKLSISKRNIERVIKELKDSGKIIRKGNNRSGHWEIL